MRIKALEPTGPRRGSIELWYCLALNFGAPGMLRWRARRLNAKPLLRHEVVS